MPIEVLRGDGLEVTGYWYNPNIHPFTEYRSRRNCLQEYAKTIELPLILKDEYGLRPFVREVASDIEGRCVKCYEMRLFDTARQAAEGGFDSFTSSLFISPYQNHELMREVAERAAREYHVEFLYRDFRPYFKEGQERARALEMYIQKFCGCVFSEQERYMKKSKIIP
jgi:predicted adenine nucleotide alpha hydrolase (AANH) superfamily ATPase